MNHPPTDPGAGADDQTASDHALMVAMANGDEGALAVFYDRFADEIYRLVLRMVSDPGPAEELLQDIVWQAWRLAGQFDPGRAGLRTWVHMLMRSRVSDWRRRRARWPTTLMPLEDLPEPQADGRPDPLERADARRDLSLAKARLSDPERQALQWTFGAGLSQAEAARQLGVPLGTLKSRVRTALGRLRGSLVDAYDGGGQR